MIDFTLFSDCVKQVSQQHPKQNAQGPSLFRIRQLWGHTQNVATCIVKRSFIASAIKRLNFLLPGGI